MKPYQIVILIVSGILLLIFFVFFIIQAAKPMEPIDVSYVKQQIKNHNDISERDVKLAFDHTYYKDEINNLLIKNHYKLISKEFSEKITVVGYSKTIYADKSIEYHIYTNKNTFYVVNEDSFKELSKKVGAEVTFSFHKKVYTISS